LVSGILIIPRFYDKISPADITIRHDYPMVEESELIRQRPQSVRPEFEQESPYTQSGEVL
jgi:hypothetical protein